EFSRVGRSQESEEKVDVNALIAEVGMLHQDKIDELSAQIIIKTPLPVIRTMKGPLRQVFQNLIGNALKYRRKDIAPVISISFEETPAYWQFSIEDNGIGIDPEYHHKIFEI